MVYATPTGDPLPGPSGLGVIPTTQTVVPGRLEASLGYESVDVSGADGRARFEPLVNLTYGLKNAEVGANYIRQKTDIPGFESSNSYFALHGKARVFTSPNTRAAVAVGAHYYDFGSDAGADLGHVLSLYATTSYDVPARYGARASRLHLGVLTQRVDVPGAKTTLTRPFAGVEFIASDAVSIGLDYLAKHGDTAQAYTVSARYQSADKPFAAQIGVGKLRSDTKFFLGLTYGFGR